MIFYLLNKGQQTVKLLNNDETIESNLDEAINTASELKFSLPLQKRLDSNIYYILIPEYHGNDFLMFKIISEDVQKDRVEYSAVESAYDELKSYEYIKDIRPHQMNAAQMLQQVLKNTRWSLGYVEDTGIQSTTFYYITILEAIQKIVDLFKVELTFTIQLDPVTQKITGRRINLYQQQGRRTGKRFEYGSNLLTVTREEDSQNLVTALVGRGKGIQVSGQDTEDASDDNYGRRLTFADVEWKTSAGAPVNKPKGQEYVEDPKATALYGFSDGHPRIGLVTFDDIEDPNQLINATWSALLEAKRPKVSFKAEVTDVGNLQLGDTIAIIRHDLGIEYFTRVYKVHHNLKDENRNTVEMGDDFSSRSITSAISTAIQTSQDATTVANTAAIAANGKNRNFYSNTKPLFANEGDNLFLNLGNGETEMWVWHHGQWEFVQSTVELHTVQKEVKEAQNGLDDAKKQIADNLAKADGDIAELNASIRDQKKAFDTDIDELNASIRDQKGTIDGLSTTINTVAIPKITDVTNKVSDALTKINDQKNIVTGLQTQSAQQGKDISKITTDIHGVSVDLANLNGDVNQTKVTVQGLQSTLGNAQGDIAQIKVDAKKLETSLSSKVDNSTYATFVNQTNQALNAKLVASDLNGYAKTTDVQATANGLQVNINSVADRMDNLKIGAENLLTNTGDFKDYQTINYGQIQDIVKSNYIPLILNHPELTHMVHIWTDWQSVYSNQEIILEKDKPYWFGFYVCTDRPDGNPFGKINILGVKKESDLSHSKVFVEQNIENYSYFGGAAKHWVWHTYKIIGDDEIYSGIRVEGSKSTSGSAYIAGYTLVQSDVAPTGHISALEDTKHELSQLSAQITANNQKFSSYYTKVETDSKANTAKNDAISAIKNDGNWRGLTNILTNSSFIQTADGFIQKVQQTMQPIINENNSGGVNLLTNTYTLHNFSNAGNAGEATGFGIDSGDSRKNELNAGEISTNVFHIYAKDLNHAPVYFGQNFTLPKGTWTLSFLVRHNGSSEQKIRLSFYTDDCANRGWIPLGTSDEIDNIWKRHQITFTTTQETFEQNPRIHMPTTDIVPGGSLYFANFKLESGSIATTWCPAPEDYATQTSFSELNQTVKGLQSTVSNNYTNLQSQISQTAGTIRSEVTNKTTNLQSQITQNANNINIKANTAKNDAISAIKNDGNWHGLINILTNSGFLQTSDGFTQKVQQTTQPMINSANSGGVNLLVNTYNFGGFTSEQKGKWTFDPKSNYSNNAGFALIKTMVAHVYGNSWNNSKLNINQTIYLPAGKYIFSFLASVNSRQNNFFSLQLTANINGVNKVLNGNSGIITYSWKTHTMEFVLTENSTISNIQLYNSSNSGLPGGSIYFANLKLESGSLATTWCPAPEDYATQTSFSELNQTIKGLQSTVSNNYTNLQSQISQTAGTIRSEVTNKTTNLQSQITQNANNFNIKLQNSASGGGVNLLANTLDFSGFYSSAVDANGKNGFSLDEKGNYYQDRNYSYIRTKVAHVWGSNFKNAPLYFNQKIYLPAGTYTLSFLARTNGNNSNNANRISLFTSYTDEHGGQQLGDSDYVHDFWEKHQITFSINENYPHSNIRLQKWNDASLPGGSIYFANLKLESGSISTTWCPAPEDQVSKNKILAQINVAAGTTLIQNDKIYMDASSTVFSGKAFIPDAAITNVSADKINTGTLDAGRINVINLNANNITTGTINGANLKINLNSGEILFQKGRIGSTNGYLNIDIDSGQMSVTDYWHDGFYFEDGKLYLSDNFALKTNWEPKYGVIRRSLNPFTVGESGIEIASPTGVSLQTMNYDGSFGGGDLGDQTKNGASVAIDKNGQALINGKQVGLVGGTFFDTDQNFLQRRPRIVVGTDAANSGLLPWGWGDPLNHVASRIVIDASYVHFPHSYKTTTGSAPNVFIASDGALVRSTSASKYKTEIKRSYSTEYGEKLLNLPTAIWTDKGQKERYEAGKRHIKPEKYFGMIAEDLADAGLDLLVSRNPLTHEIEGIQYERIAPALLPVIKKLKDKVDKLEEKINE